MAVRRCNSGRTGYCGDFACRLCEGMLFLLVGRIPAADLMSRQTRMQVNPVEHPTLRKAFTRIYGVSQSHLPALAPFFMPPVSCSIVRSLTYLGPRSLRFLLRLTPPRIAESRLCRHRLDRVRGVVDLPAGSGRGVMIFTMQLLCSKRPLYCTKRSTRPTVGEKCRWNFEVLSHPSCLSCYAVPNFRRLFTKQLVSAKNICTSRSG